jgi:hypothetical protein
MIAITVDLPTSIVFHLDRKEFSAMNAAAASVV